MLEPDFLKVAFDESNLCPYLPNQIARMPLCLCRDPLDGERADTLLELGYRRSGWFFYRTQCPNCQACQPLRLDVNRFKPGRSQRRAQRCGDAKLEIQIHDPVIDARRIKLFNLHRQQRSLTHSKADCSEQDYRSFLTDSAVDVCEISLWHEGELVGVSITDLGANSLSAVYCFFDPQYADLSPGTYAILQQIELAKRTKRRWLYLGMYVQENKHLNYKARFGPHQRLIEGKWVDFARRAGSRQKIKSD